MKTDLQKIKDGAVGVMPTDTLYGLVCRADNPEAVERLYKIKGRAGKPGTIIAADIEQLVALGFKRRYLTAVEQFWPNALSIVVPVDSDLAYLQPHNQSLAVRIPKRTVLQQMLRSTGALLTTSANHPGEAPANTISEARKYFGEAVDFYIDGGDLSDQKPSTVIRIVDDAIEVLRPGAVTIDEETGRIVT